MKKIIQSALLFSLSFLGVKSQAQVSAYTFTQTSGSYNAITGGTIIATASSNSGATGLDDVIYNLPAGTFPFTFMFNGSGYTGANISTNGFITFGATAPTSTYYTPISGTATYNGAVSALGGDLISFFNLGTPAQTGELRVEVVGTAPNREVVIQYQNWRPSYSTSTTNVYALNFQIRLVETSNIISIVYGPNQYLVGSTAISGTRQIGLRGATNTDFNNRLNPATVTFSSSITGTVNTSSQAFNTSVTPPGMPFSGLIYQWGPPVPCSGAPNAGTTTASSTSICTSQNVNLALNGATSAIGLTYQWESSPDGITWTAISSATNMATTQSVTATTYFHAIVACGVNSATSSPVTVNFGLTPNGGTTAATSTLVCPGSSVTLSAAGSSSYTGMTYQWYSSPNGVTYSPITSATLATTSQPINSTTYFQNVLTCATATSASTPLQVTSAGTTTNSVPYFEGFEGITANNKLPNCSWAASNLPIICQTNTIAASNNRIPQTGSKFASFRYGTNTAGDYFYTNGIQLTAGTNYIAQAGYVTDGAAGWSEFSLLYGSSQSSVGLVNIASATGTLTNMVYLNLNGTFSVSTTGLYYIAIKAIGNSVPWYLSFDDVSVTAAPTCTAAPFVGTISGPTLVPVSSTNTFAIASSTGNIQWYQGSSSTGPFSAIAGATNTTQGITSTPSGTVYYTANASFPGCPSYTGTPLLVTVTPLVGDMACNPIAITNFTSTTYYKLSNYGTEAGEVSPPGSGCSTNTGWCNNNLSNTIWFTFTAPASGNVTVQSPDFDTQLAVWSATNCAALTSGTTSSAVLIAANDDDGSAAAHGGVSFSSYVRALCLTPGATYYIQLDSYNTPALAGDSTKLRITDLGANSFTGPASAYCLPSTASASLVPNIPGGAFTVNSSTVTAFTPSVTGAGTFTINYTAYGCSSSSIVTVNNTPTITASASNPTVCQGSSTNLTASGATTYTWNTSATGSVIAVTPSVLTTYTVTGSANGCSSTQTVDVNVNSLPTVSLTAAQTTVCTNGPTVALTGSPAGGVYTGSNVSSGAFTPGSTSGTYTASYAVTNTVTGCSNTATINLVVSICTAVSKSGAGLTGLQVYPNPSLGEFTIELNNGASKQIEISDLTGRIVLVTMSTDNKITINLSNFTNGVYFVKIQSNKSVETVKVIKQ